MPTTESFIAYPSAVVYEKAGDRKTRGKAVDHLLWGEWVRVLKTDREWCQVQRRGRTGWLRRDELQTERLLEVYFVDIGQGDGCLIVTPDDRHIIVDAGAGDNMHRLLRWKYGEFRKPFTFAAAIATHPDLDHYYGFRDLFSEPNLSFGAVFHNGLFDRGGKVKEGIRLGPRADVAGVDCVTGLVETTDALKQLLASAPAAKTRYGQVMAKALAAHKDGRISRIELLDASRRHLPGFAPGNARGVAIEVLGPLVREAEGVRGLPWFKDVGKTKNGHSVVLRLVYGDVSILLGGDLNTESERYLLEHHTGASYPANAASAPAFIDKARRVFRSDFAKACHHGSADFTDVFLKAVDARATVISSGDAEAYMHPRPDALGAFGKHGRGNRPLLFSTELSRSTEETVKAPSKLRNRLIELRDRVADAKDEEAREKAKDAFYKEVSKLNRSVEVYGMINLRTDGKRALFAHMIEKSRGYEKRWDLHAFEWEDGDLVYKGKGVAFDLG